MTAAVAPTPEQVVLLDNVSWETYTNLLKELNPSPGKRLAYDQGTLQIMVLSSPHELPNRLLGYIVVEFATVMDLEFCESGSTTFKREDLKQGFEADTSFYFRNVKAILGKGEISLPEDPAPDLVIEIDITRSSLNKFPIFAAFGVAEIWRYHRGIVKFFELRDDRYEEAEKSVILTPVTSTVVSELLATALRQPRRSILRRKIQDWIRDNRPA